MKNHQQEIMSPNTQKTQTRNITSKAHRIRHTLTLAVLFILIALK